MKICTHLLPHKCANTMTIRKCNIFIDKRYTVDSLLFVGYQFSWVQRNHESKCSTNYKFSIGFECRDLQNHEIKNIQENASFPPQSTKMNESTVHVVYIEFQLKQIKE